VPNIIYDLVEPDILTNYARAYDNEVLRNVFVLDQWLPPRQMDDLEYRIRAGQIQDVDVAQFRAWDTPAAMTGRPGVARIRGELAPVSRMTPLGEEEQLRLRSLMRGNDDPLIDAVYDDTDRMIRSVQGRMELARGQLLSTGKVTLNENGLQIEADFTQAFPNWASTHLVSAGTVWTNTGAATPLSNLLAWQDTYIQDTGQVPGTVLMAQARLSNLYLNAEMRSAAAAQGTTPSRINKETVDAIFAANGLPPITVYDTKVRVDGISTRVIAADLVIFLPPAGEPFGNTFYGITAESLFLKDRGLLDASEMPGIVAVVLQDEHPVQTFTLGTAISLPVLPNPELLFVADVA
jgi:hypothetical protein